MWFSLPSRLFFVLCFDVTKMTSQEVLYEEDRSTEKDSQKNDPLGKARKSLKAINAQILACGYTKGLFWVFLNLFTSLIYAMVTCSRC